MYSKTNVILNFGVNENDTNAFRISSYDLNSEVSYTFCRMAYRHTPTFISLNTRGVMVLGGTSDNSSGTDVDFFDYKSKCQYKLPHMNHDRWGAGACCIDGNVVICGGFNDDRQPINLCEFYQWNIRKWKVLPKLLDYRAGAAVVSLSNKMIVVIGGRTMKKRAILASVECGRLTEDCLNTEFDIPSSGFWRRLAPMRKARLAPSAVVLNDKIIVIGGFDGNMMGSVEIFAAPANDVRLGQWTTHRFELNQKRNWSTAVIASDGIYIFGSEKAPRNSTERLQIKMDSNRTVDEEDFETAGWKSICPTACFPRIKLDSNGTAHGDEFETAGWEWLRSAACFRRVIYAFVVPSSVFPCLDWTP